MKPTKWLSVAAATAGLIAAGQASAIPVGLELMLLVDVSGSIDATEYQLQRTGYVQAFQSAAVQAAIAASPGGAIAASYVEWSGATQQSMQVGWTLINDAASANGFASLIGGTARIFNGNTAVQSALDSQYTLFGTETGGTDNGFESLRQVIDLSGDGVDNASPGALLPAVGRSNALAAGVDAINGIAILGDPGVAAYYQTNVIGGASGFYSEATSFATFGDAIQLKLEREIRGVPEPGSLALLGLGLAGAAVARRRKKSA